MTIYHQESQISLIFRPSISSASWTAVVMIIGRFFYLFILQLCCPNGISLMENSGCLHRGKPAATESRYPTYGTCWVFLCFHNPPNSDMDYGLFNVRSDVNACDCTRACTDTRKRALHWKLTPGEKSLAAPENQTCVEFSTPARRPFTRRHLKLNVDCHRFEYYDAILKMLSVRQTVPWGNETFLHERLFYLFFKETETKRFFTSVVFCCFLLLFFFKETDAKRKLTWKHRKCTKTSVCRLCMWLF